MLEGNWWVCFRLQQRRVERYIAWNLLVIFFSLLVNTMVLKWRSTIVIPWATFYWANGVKHLHNIWGKNLQWKFWSCHECCWMCILEWTWLLTLNAHACKSQFFVPLISPTSTYGFFKTINIFLATSRKWLILLWEKMQSSCLIWGSQKRHN